jgi:predicted nuclease of predicted toxin-antitoxin system
MVMRILLDECIPASLGRELIGHDAVTAPKLGWSGLTNGALLSRAVDARFDVFLTVDKNLPSQQNIAAYAIAVVVLRCPSNDIKELKKLVPALLSKLADARKGEATIIR